LLCYATGANAAPRQPHAELIVDRCAVDIEHVPEPAALKPHAARAVYKVIGEQENEVHMGEMGRRIGIGYDCL